VFSVYLKSTDAWRRPDVCLSNSFVRSNFKKISMFSKFLQLPILSQTTFNKIQRTYLVPSIDQYWVDHQDGILELFIGKDVVILGKYVTIFNKARIWCKCTRTKVHMKLFSSVDKIMEECFFLLFIILQSP